MNQPSGDIIGRRRKYQSQSERGSQPVNQIRQQRMQREGEKEKERQYEGKVERLVGRRGESQVKGHDTRLSRVVMVEFCII